VPPLDIILAMAAGGETAARISDRQLQAAIAAAPYVRPTLNAVASKDVTPDPAAEERRARTPSHYVELLEDMTKPEPLDRSETDLWQRSPGAGKHISR